MRVARRSVKPRFCAALGLILLAGSCAQSDPNPEPELGTGGNSKVTGGKAGASTGTGGVTGTGRGGGPPIDVGGAAGNGNGGQGGVQSCAGVDVGAEIVPPVLQLVVDTSGSMRCKPNEDPLECLLSGGGVGSKWDLTSKALKEATDAMLKTIGLGVSIFPASGGIDECKSEVKVPLALLGDPGSAQRKAVETWLASVMPDGGTPTHTGLRFGIQTVKSSTLPGNKFVVLITDGEPTQDIDCNSDPLGGMTPVQPIIDEAANAAKEKIRTFVIGSPGSEKAREPLSKIAEAGQTKASDTCLSKGPDYCHFDLTKPGLNLKTALKEALDKIMESTLSCEILVPPAPPGQTMDFKKVSVIVTRGTGTPESLPRDDTAQCTQGGWHYNDDKSKIILCPATCKKLRDDTRVDLKLSISVRFGCEPPVVIIR